MATVSKHHFETLASMDEPGPIADAHRVDDASETSDDSSSEWEGDTETPLSVHLQCRRASCRPVFEQGKRLERRISVEVSTMALDSAEIEEGGWPNIDWRLKPETLPVLPSKTKETVFFLDWDDTLFPTSSVVRRSNGSFDVRPDQLQQLEHHAVVVRDFIRTACALGRVAIVTLARRPWVEHAARECLPGVDWQAEFEFLNIPVLYARETVARLDQKLALQEEGVDTYVLCKTRAMLKAIRMLYGKACTADLNVISIGDSHIEADAAREITWSIDGDHSCKTVKFREEPSTIDELSNEIQELTAWISSVACFAGDFSMGVDDINSPDSPLHRSRKNTTTSCDEVKACESDAPFGPTLLGAALPVKKTQTRITL
eukprot:TRINITY_DN90305_c0_g1_i1.p1 TRINITY_DN90305_c0_g1~~TRINITY_DN90305_c0_g1_i1.p1  ORF type:complete len:394 (+),score=60.24 TRINITY_DN90305_c0_g1_i1:62-1183(+)